MGAIEAHNMHSKESLMHQTDNNNNNNNIIIIIKDNHICGTASQWSNKTG